MMDVEELAKLVDMGKDSIYRKINSNEVPARKQGKRWEILAEPYQVETKKVKNSQGPVTTKIIIDRDKEPPKEKETKKLYCTEAESCVWTTETGNKKAYCPFSGCIRKEKK